MTPLERAPREGLPGGLGAERPAELARIGEKCEDGLGEGASIATISARGCKTHHTMGAPPPLQVENPPTNLN